MNQPSPEIYFTTVSGGSAVPDSTLLPWQRGGTMSSRDSLVSARHEVASSQTAAGQSSAPRISVVFSFWNEEDVLPELILRLRAVFDLLLEQGEVGDYELIFVNDASTDASETVLRAESQRRGDIRLVNMSRNFGVSPCVMAGLAHASGDAIIYMDADLQDPPELIPELIRKWQSTPGVDVVHTVRRQRLGESRTKRMMTRIGYATLRAVSSIELPNEAGDFKLLSRRAVEQVLQYSEQRPFMRGLVCSIGFQQEKVYYDRQPRASGQTKFPVLGWKVIRNFLDSAVISFSDVPLKLAAVLGCVLVAAGLCWIGCLLAALALGYSPAGWSAVLAGVVFVGGLQLVSIGILGTYIGGIYFETKRRPNFIVKETWGFPVPMPERRTGL